MSEAFLNVGAIALEFRRGASRFRALDNVGFCVDRGQTYGIVGESGSGKSTLLRVIAGAIVPDTGAVELDGSMVHTLSPKRRARLVQMVFQDPYGSLHPRMTVRATLAEPLIVHGEDDISARVMAALDLVGLPKDLLYRYPNQLSGGQRQRVAIARALMLEPEVLLLDEPTSALDVSVQAEILNLLADIKDARALTCILVSHDLSVVAHLCQTVGVMLGGKLIEEAKVADFSVGNMKNSYCRELVATAAAYEAEGQA